MSRLSITLVAAFVLLAAYCVDHSLAHKTGETGATKIGCGQSCHGFTSTANTKVTIWCDSSKMTVGQTYVMHITVANPVQTQVAGGCDISCDAGGKLSVNGSGTGLFLSSGELTHTTPKSKSGDSIVWTFKFTPSKTGSIKLYAAGNAVNGNGHEDSGDQWNLTTFTATVVASSGPTVSVPTVLRDTALVGTSDTKTLWVKNIGNGPLTVSRYGLKSGSVWSIADSTSHTVTAGDSVGIKLNFQPTSKATLVDTLHIWSNDASNALASVPLVGIGTQAKIKMDSAQVAFGQVKIGQSNSIPFYIFNTGNGPMTISNIAIASPSNAFHSTSSITFPRTLGKSGGFLIDTFAFTAQKAGLDTAIVTISFAETASSRDTTLLLIGEGLANQSVAENGNDVKLVVSPNPSRGILNLQSTNDIEGASFEVMDAIGRPLLMPHMSGSSLDLSSLASGTYFLRIMPKQGALQVRRIVIER